MKEQFLTIIRNLKRINIVASPNFVTTKALHSALMNKGFNSKQASKIVGPMTINVCQAFVSDAPLFEETIETYAIFIYNLAFECNKIDSELFWQMLQKRELSLKYEI